MSCNVNNTENNLAGKSVEGTSTVPYSECSSCWDFSCPFNPNRKNCPRKQGYWPYFPYPEYPTYPPIYTITWQWK